VGCVTQVSKAPVPALSYPKSSRYLLWCVPWPHPIFDGPLGSSTEQNRYLPMLYVIWLAVGTCHKRCPNPTHPNSSTTANESLSYTFEVGIRRSSDGYSACLTDFRPVCRCTSNVGQVRPADSYIRFPRHLDFMPTGAARLHSSRSFSSFGAR